MLAAVGAALASACATATSSGATAARSSSLLLPDTDRQEALAVAEKLRRSIAAITVPGIDRAVTASIGVAVLGEDGADATALFRAADRALYAAKRNGRNRIESALAHDEPVQAEAA